MSELIDKRQWAVHAAYGLGWEAPVNYYERLLRGIMEMLQDAQNLMKIDDMPDVSRGLERVLLELEDTWTTVSLKKTEEVAGAPGSACPSALCTSYMGHHEAMRASSGSRAVLRCALEAKALRHSEQIAGDGVLAHGPQAVQARPVGSG